MKNLELIIGIILTVLVFIFSLIGMLLGGWLWSLFSMLFGIGAGICMVVKVAKSKQKTVK